MVSHITLFGWFHTAISVAALGLGFVAMLRDGKVDTANFVGKGYLWTTLVGSLTALGIFHHGGFGVGHVLTLVTLALVAVAVWAGRSQWLGWAADYVQTIAYSTSFMLLNFFTTTEGLTRLPKEHPYAAGPDDPALAPVRAALLLAYLLGVTYQVVQIRSAHRRGNTVELPRTALHTTD